MVGLVPRPSPLLTRWRKAWKIFSCVMMSSRQGVDTWGSTQSLYFTHVAFIGLKCTEQLYERHLLNVPVPT